jgi:hypothetical protein
MTVTYKPFISEKGFQSPGFVVDELGSFTIANLNTTSSIKISGQTVITPTSLGSGIASSNLTSVGTLLGLAVNSTAPVNLTTTNNINLTGNNVEINASSLTVTPSGTITMVPTVTGSIDNTDIGSTIPGNGNFINLTATDNIYLGSQNIKSLSIAFAVALS